MRDITDKLSLQGTKNNVTQVQETSNSIQPALPHLLCPLPSPPQPSSLLWLVPDSHSMPNTLSFAVISVPAINPLPSLDKDNFSWTLWALQIDSKSSRVINSGSGIHTTELIKRTSARIWMEQTFVQYLLCVRHCHDAFFACVTLFNHQINPLKSVWWKHYWTLGH